MAKAEEKAKAAAEEEAKANAEAARKEGGTTDYVAKGTIAHSLFGKRTKIFAGEPIPKKTTEVMLGANGEGGHLLDHWIERGIVMKKSDWDKQEADKEAVEKKAKAALKR